MVVVVDAFELFATRKSSERIFVDFIIIYVALGQSTELTAGTTVAATTLSQSKAHTAAQGDRLASNRDQENQESMVEQPHVDHGGDRVYQPNGPASSASRNLKISSPNIVHLPSSADSKSSGLAEVGKRPTASTLTRTNTGTGAGIGTWSSSDGTSRTLNDLDLEAGGAAKSIELLAPSHSTTSAARAYTPSALEEGLGLFFECDGPEASSTLGGRPPNHGYTHPDSSDGPAPERTPISRRVTHPIPSPVPLVPPSLAATTFEAYVASLGYGNGDRGRRASSPWSGLPVRPRPASARLVPTRTRAPQLEIDTKQTGSW